MDDTIARILDASYMDDLAARPIEEIRAMRAECQEVETGLSFLRRVAQGHLDIVAAEIARRRDGGEPADVAALVDRLPEILADHLRAPGNGRLPTTLGPGRPDSELEERLADLVAASGIDTLESVDDDALRQVGDDLSELEQEASTRRRALFDRIDGLQAELTRRYRTGEASVESLLS
jgi:anti-sigma-K factor RsiG